MTTEASRMTRGKGPRVVVVGPCASGKTTLVENLKSVGVDARVSGQEHSAIRNLWQRLEPDVLIALDLELETLRERRYPTWSAGLYDVQHRRLEEAFEAADVTIDTSETPEEDVLEVALAVIAHYRASSE
ncbi:MAG: ATP-binding protein [Chloroflexota bacterium]|nr:ATP-binding protein [Chloroflexota bacterium]